MNDGCCNQQLFKIIVMVLACLLNISMMACCLIEFIKFCGNKKVAFDMTFRTNAALEMSVFITIAIASVFSIMSLKGMHSYLMANLPGVTNTRCLLIGYTVCQIISAAFVFIIGLWYIRILHSEYFGNRNILTYEKDALQVVWSVQMLIMCFIVGSDTFAELVGAGGDLVMQFQQVQGV